MTKKLHAQKISEKKLTNLINIFYNNFNYKKKSNKLEKSKCSKSIAVLFLWNELTTFLLWKSTLNSHILMDVYLFSCQWFWMTRFQWKCHTCRSHSFSSNAFQVHYIIPLKSNNVSRLFSLSLNYAPNSYEAYTHICKYIISHKYKSLSYKIQQKKKKTSVTNKFHNLPFTTNQLFLLRKSPKNLWIY